ncbi:MAG: hypothetical protein ACI4B4_04160 [Segatella copri]
MSLKTTVPLTYSMPIQPKVPYDQPRHNRGRYDMQPCEYGIANATE